MTLKNILIRFVLILICAGAPTLSATAQQSPMAFLISDITICPATQPDEAPPNFSSPSCQSGKTEDVDPQGTLIWVKVTVPLTSIAGPNGEPLSLYVSGKMSSKVYLNGEYVGHNGIPGINKETETIGKMDAELFPSQRLFKRGDNEVVFLASAHHGFLRLYRPLHMIAIAPAGTLSGGNLLRFFPTLITLGLFLLGNIYFGVMGFIGTPRIRFWGLSAICFFAGAQLISETLRGLISYAYPVHDIRIVAIAIFSTAFGLGVTFHILNSFLKTPPVRSVLALALLSSIALVFVPGFDFKALAGMTIPLFASLITMGLWAYQRRARAFSYFMVLFIFIASIFIFRGFFLDTIFFLIVAILLLLLFVEQALTLAKEARQRRAEEARADRLELALTEAQERTEATQITVKSAGKVERIATNQIILCNGASGYTEIILVNGRTLLHTASLNEMEETLPAIFLRVHRSHLVNLMYVTSLNRETSGTGTLILSEGLHVPVSRRIMPKVRQALG